MASILTFKVCNAFHQILELNVGEFGFVIGRVQFAASIFLPPFVHEAGSQIVEHVHIGIAVLCVVGQWLWEIRVCVTARIAAPFELKLVMRQNAVDRVAERHHKETVFIPGHFPIDDL